MQKRINNIFNNPLSSQLSRLLWALAAFSYFFQFPFSTLSNLIIPSLAGFLICKLTDFRSRYSEKDWIIVYCIYFIFISISGYVSIISGTQFANVIRFFLILVSIPLFALFKDKAEEASRNVKMFLILASIKSVVLIGIAVYMMYIGSYTEMRAWAFEHSYGDIYINPNSKTPSVQVQGNGILPLALILACETRMPLIIIIVLLGGCLAAGNIAFVFAIILYGLFCMVRYIFRRNDGNQLKKTVLLVAAFATVVAAGLYFSYQWSLKSSFSNVIRAEQIEALVDGNIAFGNGVGNYIQYSGSTRNYDGDIYFEMQTLYVLNQIGVIGLVLFYYLVFSKMSKSGTTSLMLFIIYILYSFWNPYCFDTTEMMAVYLLVNKSLFVVRRFAKGRIE